MVALPIKNSLNFSFDVDYMIGEIVGRIKDICEENNVQEPDIFSEFGSFTVSDSGATFFSIVYQKKQNEKERWNMIDGSFMTTLPDTWAISKRFIMLPVNNWNDEYERVFLGGMTCDSDDYYNSEQHINAIYMPKYQEERKQYIGYFNTGAYQDTLGGFGGIQHCLIPKPKHVLIDRLPDGTFTDRVFAEQQSAERMLQLLGYLPMEVGGEEVTNVHDPCRVTMPSDDGYGECTNFVDTTCHFMLDRILCISTSTSDIRPLNDEQHATPIGLHGEALPALQCSSARGCRAKDTRTTCHKGRKMMVTLAGAMSTG